MITIYDLKPKFQNLLRPMVDTLAKRGVSANQVTYAAVVLSAFVGAAIMVTDGALWSLLLLPVSLLIRMGLNAMDGMLAKEHHMQSDLGAILNEMGDVVSDVVMYLPLALLANVPAVWLVLFVIVGIFTEMAGVLAAVVGTERRYDGPMGKSDRAFVIGLIALLLGLGVETGFWLETLLIIATLSGVWTTFRRVKGGLS
ncbi:MAG: CDP-alcohol phosphatidyltransferase family protein [Campylobacterota bacterium]